MAKNESFRRRLTKMNQDYQDLVNSLLVKRGSNMVSGAGRTIGQYWNKFQGGNSLSSIISQAADDVSDSWEKNKEMSIIFVKFGDKLNSLLHKQCITRYDLEELDEQATQTKEFILNLPEVIADDKIERFYDFFNSFCKFINQYIKIFDTDQEAKINGFFKPFNNEMLYYAEEEEISWAPNPN